MEAARALGAYYTPAELADPMTRWAVRGPGDSVFDPSCGEGSFLASATGRLLSLGAEPRRLSDQIAGVDVNARALSRARGALLSRHPGLRWGRLAQDDFFLFARENLGKLTFDAVVGNPPFLRTQGRSVARKRLELETAARGGISLTADASSWAAFTATACGFVRPGGRLAMVVPREALFVNYTKPLLAMLERRFASVNLMALEGSWFEGALVKVALLLCEGVGPGVLRLHEAGRLGNLEELVEAAPAAVPAASWVWSRIPGECRTAAAETLESPHLAPLTSMASVFIGVVTGEKDFFLLPTGRARELGLPERWLLPALARPSHLEGSTFTATDLALLDRAGEACRLLAVPTDYAGGEAGLDAWLASGRERGIDRNYKCRTRSPWYSVRRLLPAPDLLLGYLVKRRPRLAAGARAIHSTNNLHRLYLSEPWRSSAALVAAAAYNAATMLSVELLGRVSAGGALKIEPGDATRVRLIHPELLGRVPRAATAARAIDRALRDGRDDDAFAMADDLARRATGWKARDLSRLRRAQQALRDARLR